MPEYVPAPLKKIVQERAHGCCEYCMSQARYSPQPFSIEHILPLSKGGETVLENLALSCQGCNNHKYIRTEARDPFDGKTVPLYNPRREQWQLHFVFEESGALIIGLTATGRATVEALRLNRSGLMNLRKALWQLGKHPPF